MNNLVLAIEKLSLVVSYKSLESIFKIAYCYNITLRRVFIMQVLFSLKSAKNRAKDCQIVRRRGKLFVICKSNPRFKARQG